MFALIFSRGETSMYNTFLIFHNILRWAVLIGGVLAIGHAFWGWFGKKEWTPTGSQFGLLFTISMDLQLLLGLLLYFVFSPITTKAFSDFGGAMGDGNVRFYLVEHIFGMVLAVALVHIGRSRAKKMSADLQKHKTAAIFFTIALVVVLASIPWARPLLRIS
jgi:hypothetical protein